MWNRLVCVWPCCAYTWVIRLEYATMHCWQGCHIGYARWLSPNALVLFSSECISLCKFVNILAMSRSLSRLQTRQNICAWSISNCLDVLMCVSCWNMPDLQQKSNVSTQFKTRQVLEILQTSVSVSQWKQQWGVEVMYHYEDCWEWNVDSQMSSDSVVLRSQRLKKKRCGRARPESKGSQPLNKKTFNS